MTPAYRLVIFDFDGTLADTIPWFEAVIDEVADRFGLPRLDSAGMEILRTAGPREIPGRSAFPAGRCP